MGALQQDLDALRAHRERCAAFRWEPPDAFNFGRDVVDHFGRDPARPALLWRSPHGEERRLSYAQIASASDRVAHLLIGRGIAAGDPVIVMLPKVPEWQIVMVGALKAGALVIPSSTILRPKDIQYRGAHSGAVALFAAEAQVLAVEAVRGDLPDLTHCFVVGEECDVFRNETDLLEKVAFYLDHPEKRREIAMAGQRRTLSEHLYSHRLVTLVEMLRQAGVLPGGFSGDEKAGPLPAEKVAVERISVETVGAGPSNP